MKFRAIRSTAETERRRQPAATRRRRPSSARSILTMARPARRRSPVSSGRSFPISSISPGVSWRYYQQHLGPGLWHAFDAIQHVRYGPDYDHVVTPPETILTDVSRGQPPGNVVGDAGRRPALRPFRKRERGRTVLGCRRRQRDRDEQILERHRDLGRLGRLGRLVRSRQTAANARLLRTVVPRSAGRHFSVCQARATSRTCSTSSAAFSRLSKKRSGFPRGALGATDVRANDLSDIFDFSQTPRAFVRIRAPRFVPGKEGSNQNDGEDP